jgi:hypothetical protein
MKNLNNLGLWDKFPAGTYYIGDLCYVMQDGLWDEWLELTSVRDSQGNVQSYEDGIYKFRGFNVGWHGTNYGDGVYLSDRMANISKTNVVPVDSGTIGIIPLKALSEWLSHEEMDEVMSGSLNLVHRFDHDFHVELSVNMQFGNLIINTDGSDDYEEEEEYEFSDDDN